MSTLKTLTDSLKSMLSDVNILNSMVHTTNNIYFSQATVTSVDKNLTTCNVLLLEAMVNLEDVLITIPVNELNMSGHIQVGDTVLIGYNYGYDNPYVEKKVETKDKSQDKNMNIQRDGSTMAKYLM